MKSRPRIGTTGELKFVVGPEHVIDFATDGMPSVLSTPRLIGLIERTARDASPRFSKRTSGRWGWRLIFVIWRRHQRAPA